MSLFAVTRYDETKEDDKKEDDKKLLKIQKKIEKRKLNRMKNKLKKNEKTAVRMEKKEKTVTKSVEHERMDVDIENIDEIKKDEPSKEPVQNEFVVLGADVQKEKLKVKRILPAWLLNPIVIKGNIKDNLKPLSEIPMLDDNIKDNLVKNNITQLFPVQSMVVPHLLKSSYQNSLGTMPRDICVSAPTGSGKTLAYIIPIVNDIITSYYLENKIRALIILPTQSLAVQIYEQFKLYSTFKDFSVDIGLVTGSTSLAQEQRQIITLSTTWGPSSKVHILVCTPGRLVEHLRFTKGFDLSNIEYLVIDEADRVLDSIQDDWLYHLEKHLQDQSVDKNFNKSICNVFNTKDLSRPQRLLFSATLSQDPEQLEKLHLFQPILFTSVVDDMKENEENLTQIKGKYTMPSELIEKYIVCSLDLKPLILYKYIMDQKLKNVLVFTNTIESVHRLRILLKILAPELNVREISSKMSIKKKRALMKIYGSGTIDVLVCTDSMARGIDLPNVQAVFSYAAPKYIKNYIHRVGRTARAGITGTAVTLLEPHEKRQFLQKLKEIEKTNVEEVDMNMDELHSMDELYASALEKLREQLAKEEENAKMQIKKEKGLVKKRPRRMVKNKTTDDKEETKKDEDGNEKNDDEKTNEEPEKKKKKKAKTDKKTETSS